MTIERTLIDPSRPDSYPVLRLIAALCLMTVGSAGMYVVTVVLPLVQADFAVSRSDASLPYTLTMIGFGLGGIVMGKLADRFGVMVPLLVASVSLCIGFWWASHADNLWQFSAAHGLFIGLFGSAATFAPLMADTSLWFTKRRGIAVAICASGNYVGGSIWPNVAQHYFDSIGWRDTYFGLAIFSMVTMIPLALFLYRRPPVLSASGADVNDRQPARQVGETQNAPAGLGHIDVHPNLLFGLLCLAALGTCLAMSMPQVHIVAYCGDLGYGAASGALMLSLMLGFGIVSRLGSGLICDRIGGLRTLLLGASLQCLALIMFLFFDGMTSLYVISAMFGLFQGGIVPSYAIIMREYFPPQQAGARVGTVITASLLGMAIGGWLAGAIFDFTGSYRAAFINGIGWNVLTVLIVIWLLARARPGRQTTRGLAMASSA